MRNILLAAAGAVLAASTAHAQVSDNRGWMVNAHVAGASTGGAAEDAEMRRGGALGLAVGYGFSDRLALLVSADGGRVKYPGPVIADAGPSGSYDQVTVDIALRASFLDEHSPLRPYLTSGITGVAESSRLDSTGIVTSGGGITIGGGVQYFTSPKVALEAGLLFTAGSFTGFEVEGEKYEYDEGLGFGHSRLQLGITWHP
ncbi:outer membrane beta-barrel protein [Longimicrobium sp.]|jgi:opacity protein-like surface antigen|uniref:outer membrane beta-barrel protein n=1 Tax=Longimicrobium sp. TaxID=2029185 RepID=UPI002F922774